MKEPMNAPQKITLFLFPFAGGSEFSFPHFKKQLQQYFQVHVISYPGRGTRIMEPLSSKLNDLVEDAVRQIKQANTNQFCCIGHSFGTLVLYETLKSLRKNADPLPFHIFMLGRKAPSHPGFRLHGIWHELPDDSFMDRIMDIGGMPETVRNNREFMSYFLPVIRNDIRLMEEYAYVAENPFDLPFTLINGTQDPAYDVELVLGWQHETSQQITSHELPGGHFFPEEQPMALVDEIVNALKDLK